ncbi:MAG: DUF2807 domain-containing protein [Bacteroidaceae bacterium]|nr:DUF2807 domain-containing protein [Bacteroidaceae bacterium]
MRKIYLSVFLIFAIILTSCDKMVVGNKNYENRIVEQQQSSQYNSIAVYDNIEVNVSSGAPAMSIYAPSNVQAHISTTVVDGVLVIKYNDNVKVMVDEEPVVLITHPGLTTIYSNDSTQTGIPDTKATLQSLRVEGDGDIEVVGLDVPQLTATIIGNGSITLRGTARQAQYIVNGRGEIDADKMNVGTLQASIEGNGEIECYAHDHLEAHTTGMGEIKYQGPPTLQVTSSGHVVRDID